MSATVNYPLNFSLTSLVSMREIQKQISHKNEANQSNSCYRSCAHGESLLCLQLRVDEAYGSIQWKMTLKPRFCVKTADNCDKSYKHLDDRIIIKPAFMHSVYCFSQGMC